MDRFGDYVQLIVVVVLLLATLSGYTVYRLDWRPAWWPVPAPAPVVTAPEDDPNYGLPPARPRPTSPRVPRPSSVNPNWPRPIVLLPPAPTPNSQPPAPTPSVSSTTPPVPLPPPPPEPEALPNEPEPNLPPPPIATSPDSPMGFVSPLVKIFKPSSDTPAGKVASNMAQLSSIGDYFTAPNIVLLRDDNESIQLVVRNNAPNNLSLNYVVTKNGQTTSALTVEPYRVEFARVTYNLYRTAGDLSPPGYYSDPLTSYQPGTNINSDSDVVWWLNIGAQNTASPGQYRIALSVISSDGTKNTTQVLPVQVLSPNMPRRSAFPIAFGLGFTDGESGYTPLDYHAAFSVNQKNQVADAYHSFLSRLRLSASRPYFDAGCSSCRPLEPDGLPLAVTALDLAANTISIDFSRLDEALSKYISNGRMNFFSIYNSSWGFYRFKLPLIWGGELIRQTDSRYTAVQTLFWRAVTEHLRQRGWLQYSFIYSDEPFTCLGELTTRCRNGNYIPNDTFFFDILRDVNQETKLVVFTNKLTESYLDKISDFSARVNIFSLIDYTIPDNPYQRLWSYFQPLLGAGDERGAYWTSNSYVHADRPGFDHVAWILKYWNDGAHSVYHWNGLIFNNVDTDGDGNITRQRTNPWTDGISHRWGAGGAMFFYPPCRSGDGRCTSFTDAIVPSIRLQLFGEALETYDLLAKLSQLTNGQHDLLNQARSMAFSSSSWPHDRAIVTQYENWRTAVTRAIDQLE